MSTKLKLLGVDVASFGDAFGTTEGALDVVYADALPGVYKKLVVAEDGTPARRDPGRRRLGVRHAAAAGRTGSVLPVAPEQLVLPAGAAAAPARRRCRTRRSICSCHNVTKGAICAARSTSTAAPTVPALKKCTKAGTGCGCCVPVLKNLLTERLEAAGRSVVDKGLCEHFAHDPRRSCSRSSRCTAYRRFDDIVEAHGRGRGCEVCKPAVASILASQFNGARPGRRQAALQDTNDHFLANIQRNGTYSVVPRIPGGEITPEKLIVIGEVARDFGLYTKITGGQRIDLFGARVEQLPVIWRRLVDAGLRVRARVRQVAAHREVLRRARPGAGTACRTRSGWPSTWSCATGACARRTSSSRRSPAAPASAPRPAGKDFGVIATEKGWNLYVGGNGGATPRTRDLLAEDLSTRDAGPLPRPVPHVLHPHRRPAAAHLDLAGPHRRRPRPRPRGRGRRLARPRRRAGGRDGPPRRTYADEWGATLDDPEKLARFVSFVNAPGTPDPNISFATERGQIKPAVSDEPVVLGSTIPVGAP